MRTYFGFSRGVNPDYQFGELVEEGSIEANWPQCGCPFGFWLLDPLRVGEVKARLDQAGFVITEDSLSSVITNGVEEVFRNLFYVEEEEE